MVTNLTSNHTVSTAQTYNSSDSGLSLFYRSNISRTILISAILGLIDVTTILGNIFVLIAIKLEKNLRKKSNILIVSLAITDLLVAVLVIPVAIVYEIHKKWILGSMMCDAWIVFDVLCCTSSILHLVAIALDRYWSVSNVKYMLQRSLKRIIIMIVISWTFGLVIAVIPFLFIADQEITDRCAISMNIPYTIISTFGAFYIPAIIMIVIYAKLYKIARKSIQDAGNRRRRGSVDNLSDLEDIEKAQERKTTVMFSIITGAFIVCWLPFFIVALIGPLLIGITVIPPLLHSVVLWLGYCNSMVNPVIYAITNVHFRHAFHRMFFKRCQ